MKMNAFILLTQLIFSDRNEYEVYLLDSLAVTSQKLEFRDHFT